MKKLFTLFLVMFVFGVNAQNLTTTDESSSGACDGSVFFNDSGLFTSWNWLDTDSTTVLQSNTDSLTGLCAGTYYLEYTDSASNINITSFTIGTAGPCTGFSVSVTSTNETSYGACDGSGTASVTGGTAPYSYLWDDPNNTPAVVLPGACAGTYTCTVTDMNGCTISGTVIVGSDSSANPCGSFNLTATATNESSNGACDGSIVLNVSGGTPGYTYSWTPGGQNTSTISNLCPGTYSVNVMDTDSCSVSGSWTIITDSAGSVNCSANFYTYNNPNGQTEFYNYSIGNALAYDWDFGDGNISSVMNPIHSYASPGTYNVCLTLSTNGGCYDTLCQTINTQLPPNCNADFVWFTDSVNTSLLYVVNLSNSSGSTTYLWDMGDGTTYTTMEPIHTYAGNGPYNVCLTISDSTGCTSTFCDSIGSNLRAQGFTVQVVQPGNTSPSSASVDENKLEMSIYPNPASVSFELLVSSIDLVEGYELYSIAGKRVASENINSIKTTIDISNSQSGIYIIRIKLKDGSSIFDKIVKE